MHLAPALPALHSDPSLYLFTFVFAVHYVFGIKLPGFKMSRKTQLTSPPSFCTILSWDKLVSVQIKTQNIYQNFGQSQAWGIFLENLLKVGMKSLLQAICKIFLEYLLKVGMESQSLLQAIFRPPTSHDCASFPPRDKKSEDTVWPSAFSIESERLHRRRRQYCRLRSIMAVCQLICSGQILKWPWM